MKKFIFLIKQFPNCCFVNLIYLNGLWTSSSKLYKSIGRELVQMKENSNENVTKPLKNAGYCVHDGKIKAVLYEAFTLYLQTVFVR